MGGQGAREGEPLVRQGSERGWLNFYSLSWLTFPRRRTPSPSNLKLVAMSSTSTSSYVGHSIEAVTWAGMGDIHLVFRDRGVGDDG